MHELVETLKWLGIALGWVSAVGMSWALVKVGSTPKEYDEDRSVIRLSARLVPRAPQAQVALAQPSGRAPLAKVIPMRHV